MNFVTGALLFILLFIFSIYGLLVTEIKIGFGNSAFILKGWLKNSLCVLGLLVISCISAYPVLLTLYNAFSQANK